MQDSTATPETGPVDAPASNESTAMDHALKELYADMADDKSADDEEVKDTDSEGQAEEAPEAEESATDPIEPDEEAEEATPDEDDTEAEADADEPRHTVRINGEDVEVTESELKKGYSRTQDYKAKTMALADERRAVEAKEATIERDVKLQYANELKQRVDAFEALDPILSEARQIDWAALERDDPATFVQYSRAVQDRIAKIDAHRAEIEQIEGERAQTLQAEAQAEAAQRMEVAANKIVELMPELAEGNAFQEFATSNIGFLREVGFTPEEISEAVDDRVLIMADKARRWDALQKAKTSLPAKKIVPKSSVKPMTSDASDSSRSSRPKLRAGASRDEALAYALNELRKG